MAAHRLCMLAEVSFDQFEQWQVLRAAPRGSRHGARTVGARGPSDFARRGTGLGVNPGPDARRCRNAGVAARARRPKGALRAVAGAGQACHEGGKLKTEILTNLDSMARWPVEPIGQSSDHPTPLMVLAYFGFGAAGTGSGCSSCSLR